MNRMLEFVCVPVTDLDRAKRFYANGLGFHVGFVFLKDPDGNGWAVRQINGRN